MELLYFLFFLPCTSVSDLNGNFEMLQKIKHHHWQAAFTNPSSYVWDILKRTLTLHQVQDKVHHTKNMITYSILLNYIIASENNKFLSFQNRRKEVSINNKVGEKHVQPTVAAFVFFPSHSLHVSGDINLGRWNNKKKALIVYYLYYVLPTAS